MRILGQKLIKILCMLSFLISFFGFTNCAPNPAFNKEEALIGLGSKEELSILFIGNSYSFGVTRELKKIAVQNSRSLHIGHSTYAGWSLKKHLLHPPTLRKLRSRNWDVIVLQDYSLHPSLPERQRKAAMKRPIVRLVAEAHKIGAIPVLYQTWGRRDGNPEVNDDNFLKMNARVRRGYQNASADAGDIPIVSVGDTWEEQYKGGNGDDLFIEDGSHPSHFGNQITAKTFYDFLYTNRLP